MSKKGNLKCNVNVECVSTSKPETKFKDPKMVHQPVENFDNFCKHILPRTCGPGILFCGSFYEQPIEYALLNLTDHDQMFFEPKLIAATNAATTPKCFHGEILIIETKNCHLGFARLLRHCGENTEYFVWIHNSRNSPATQMSIMTSPEFSDLLSAALPYIPRKKAFREFMGDFVYSVLCPDWPSEADEWRTRKRNGWPSKDTIDKIVQGGCHLVPKSHKGNPNDNTSFRYSFSQAELILTDTWNEVQKYIYHILRILKSDVVKKCGDKKNTFLCTYYFKTLMFWACEEKPSTCTFWGEDRIEAAIEELLLQMIQWLIDKNCPNYFMRENNMLDHLQSDFDVTNEVLHLLDACQAISTVISSQLMAYRGKMLHIRFSDKALLICQLALNRRVFVNAWSQKRGRYVVKNLSSSALLRQEVEHLFRAVQLHCLLMSDKSSSETVICEKQKSYETEALGYFERSIEKKETKNYTDVFISSLDSLLGIANKFLNGKPSEHNQRISRPTDEDKLTKKAMEALFKYVLSTLDKDHHNPSYFISAAYYANFYYTCLREYKPALDICVKALKYFSEHQNAIGLNLNTYEEAFTNEMLCMFINSPIAGIYDAGIEVVFGFLTLCVATIFPNEKSSSDRNLFLHDLVFQMCPVEFLKYIQIRCRNNLHPNESVRPIDTNLFHEADTKIKMGGITDLKKLSNSILSAAIIVDSDIYYRSNLCWSK